ncbi:MAG TPA: glycosyltransferase [Coleofasciculaceae cyanobacterium]
MPLNNHLVENAILVAKIFRKKLILENHVSLYDNLLEERKKYNEGIQKTAIEIRRDKLALCQPDYIINTSNYEPAYWEKKLGIKIDRDKVFVAPLFSSSTLVHQKIFRENSILQICWWGSFLPLHGLDNIIKAMELLKKREVKFTCNLFGINNSEYNVYVEKIRLAQLDSSVFLRKDLTFYDDSLPRYLVENCDLALGIFGNTDKAYNTFPTKLVESLSMGIPTLTMKSPSLQEFLNPETDLWTCKPLPEAIAESILSIADGTANPVDWEQTRQKVLNTFSITRYQEVVEQILDRAINNSVEKEITDVQGNVKYEQKTS